MINKNSIPYRVFEKGVSHLMNIAKKSDREFPVDEIGSGYDLATDLNNEINIYKIWIETPIQGSYAIESYACYITDMGQIIEMPD